ncbi:hypothetical protein HIM_09763 [Hirsutella minnesotensis 3608]|uniref:pyruvate, water dikinase n=1 Tax=Hirsutella minnesotensis 3608 TaxID=1043627 RepID=A0A0F8A2X7_9HYPO|nr:hypothetical protein HIM_09763 [Hirsutella minnesotensis 3608]
MANVNKTTNAADLTLVVSFEHLGRGDGALVGGKDSSLGEMISALGAKGIAVPPGFATIAQAYWQYIDCNAIRDKMAALVKEWQESKLTLAETGQAVRSLFLRGTWPSSAAAAIRAAYRQLSAKTGIEKLGVAETYLNISGEEALLDACRRCYASLFTDRAISYRQMRGFDHMSVALSIGVQQMARSDAGGSGVMFSIDTESGFDKVVLIDAAWGLGENVVQGTVDPDEYQVFKPLLGPANLVPILDKKRGAKDIKMVYGDQQTPTRNVHSLCLENPGGLSVWEPHAVAVRQPPAQGVGRLLSSRLTQRGPQGPRVHHEGAGGCDELREDQSARPHGIWLRVAASRPSVLSRRCSHLLALLALASGKDRKVLPVFQRSEDWYDTKVLRRSAKEPQGECNGVHRLS